MLVTHKEPTKSDPLLGSLLNDPLLGSLLNYSLACQGNFIDFA